MVTGHKSSVFLFVLITSVMLSLPAAAQDEAKPAPAPAKAGPAQTSDPLKRPISEEQKKRNDKALKTELGKVYKKWLDEDVRWIITDEERNAFKQLSNDEERDQFVEQFWLRRDPTPDTVENEFKEEHYRRIAYANEHFAAGIPGWKTDRGRSYVVWGPPDEIESHAGGGAYERPMEEGGGTTSTFPFEIWRYRYIEELGQEVNLEFVDDCQCGLYELTIDRSKKDALLYTPNGGLTMYEQMGLANKADRFTGGGIERLGAGPFNKDLTTKQFDRIEQYAKWSKAPPIKFKDLEEVVTHKIRINLMPFDVRTDLVKVTSDTVLVPVTIQVKNRDITFVNKDGVQHGVVNIFGRVTTLTGRIVQTFEDTVTQDVPAELLPQTVETQSLYWKALPLRPGRYRMDIVVKDVNGDRVGDWSKGMIVPDFSDDKLASSTLILADQLEPVPTKSVGAGNFVIGTTKVRPRVEPSDGSPATFKKTQQFVNFWMQVYNLGIDDKSHRSSAVVQYDIVNTADKKAIVHETQDIITGDQATLQKRLPIKDIPAGTYELTIKISDNISKQTIAPTAKFIVQ
jgi:GWxTD domain-containing protein